MNKLKMFLFCTIGFSVVMSIYLWLTGDSGWGEAIIAGVLEGVVFGAIFTAVMSFIVKRNQKK